jgi:membrane associated rhomboid family serine protease
MIPLRALIYRRTTPVVTLLLIAVNTLCFLYELTLPYYYRNRFIAHYALVPDHLHLTTLFTSMFLHAGWLHLIGNMWFLWVFGSHVEEAMGSAKYLIFYLISGVASACAQVFVNLGSAVPTIGASGAIAGIMGGFLVLYPRARVVTLIFVFIFITTVEIPAAFMLLYWFLLQLISGLSSFASVTEAGGVAWFAHVGGFLVGLALVRLFRDNPPRYYSSY